MSENKSKFRIRKGDTEIEFEGSSDEVNGRYREAFDWVKSVVPQENTVTKPKEKNLETQQVGDEEKKKGTRGPEIWSPAIDELISGGFFKLPNRRQNLDVVKALADKALPVKGKAGVIRITLTRKVRRGNLKGTKGPDGWAFWTE